MGNGTHARSLLFDATQVQPQAFSTKSHGFAVRCVRNSPPPVCVDPNFTVSVVGQGWTSTQSRQEGACAPFPTLTITATPAAGATFQWFYNTVQSTTDGTPTAIPGAVTNTFIPLRDTIGTRYYFAIVHFPGCGIRTTQVSAAHTVDPFAPVDPSVHCNMGMPNWGSASIGIASFATLNTWIVSGNGITQEWSDAVRASLCSHRTTNFASGGSAGNWNADCGSSAGNPNFGGDYFTWCAVIRFADVLCPPAQGWRVPTCADFVDLDIALGGDGTNRSVTNENAATGIVTLGYVGTTAVNSPASTWGGARFTGWGVLSGQLDVQSFYWSQTSFDGVQHANTLRFNTIRVDPQSWNDKTHGFAVRCVR